jgi:hypothetical protein
LAISVHHHDRLFVVSASPCFVIPDLFRDPRFSSVFQAFAEQQKQKHVDTPHARGMTGGVNAVYRTVVGQTRQ